MRLFNELAIDFELEVFFNDRMPYTEATLLEVQRCATVVPLFSRANIQDEHIGKYVIPKVITAYILES